MCKSENSKVVLWEGVDPTQTDGSWEITFFSDGTYTVKDDGYTAKWKLEDNMLFVFHDDLDPKWVRCTEEGDKLLVKYLTKALFDYEFHAQLEEKLDLE